jgi:hypothetical protein
MINILVIFFARHHHAIATTGQNMASELSGEVIRKQMNIENEGTSHDVVDNKGSNFLTHDVIDNKGIYCVYPTIFMMGKDLCNVKCPKEWQI